MKQHSILKLIAGHTRFLKNYSSDANKVYRNKASKGQEPKIMMISCCDSRVNPVLITDSSLGEIFTVTNIGNLVPPYGWQGDSSLSSALNFALDEFEIENIIVLGHSGCAGIRTLLEANEGSSKQAIDSSILKWISIASTAKNRALEKYPNCSIDTLAACCEREALLVSLENLLSFPKVANAIEQRKLAIHAWHFDIKTGKIESYDKTRLGFFPIIDYQ